MSGHNAAKFKNIKEKNKIPVKTNKTKTNKNTGPGGVPCHQDKGLRLTSSFSSSQELTLNLSGWNCQHCRGSLHDNTPPHPHPPPPDVALPETTLSLLLLIMFLPHPVSAYRNLPVCTASQGIHLGTGWDCASFMNHSIQPIRSLHLLN